ncbi:ran-binding protein 3-like isoform X3 [Bos indicus x Bos taurus]|uniref:ran-binding protein 3-like isoform X3 n=1 Tax=Bos indicus x Bos taurus TaxID=30522 RepID=UPI000F7D4D57|nr:ran-binding protein 3-like isoform X3 [Bos indicus x Bos taurus]
MQRKGSSHLFNSVHTCRLKLPQEQQHQEKSVIAQPIFVFEKREQTFKRPADDILYEAAERECNEFSRKRVRASSFTWHTTDSQNQGGPVKHSELVLRPAILQPPQAQGYIKVRKSFGDHVLESCKVKEKNKSKIYEGNSYLLSENLPNARISIQLSTNQNALGTTSLRCQPSEDKYSMKSCSSDFVFGENMVERVLGTQKLTQPQLESDLYIKEKPFKFTLKIPVNSPNSRTDTIENISLIESAAAFSFKPSPKCLLEKIDIITGEEAEHNVLEINCKLFRFNKTTQSWTERGRGALRLNDTARRHDCGTFQSRLIMRNQGSLRLILNSKLWAQMEIQRANHKNLQITATDLEDCNVKVFLIQASAKDTGRMHAAIHHRLVALRSFDKRTDANQTESQSETVLQQCNYDSCDEDEEDLIQATKARSDSYRWTHRQSVACS